MLSALCLIPAFAQRPAAVNNPRTAQPARPKLVMLVAIDQFRYDYLPRFRKEYTGGLARLLNNGASFVSAYLEHYPTVTAVGHSTMFSGATPALSGIIGNDWYDRATKKQVTSVSDPNSKLLGGPAADAEGSSPHRLLVSTIGDELKRVSSTSKVIGISMKDRSAILPAGHMADASYWFNDRASAFVSSTYYFPALPAWVQEFNARAEPMKFAGKVWLDANGDIKERRIPMEGATMNPSIYSSPYGNDLLENFVEQAIANEKLGTRGVTDVLTVSFSSNDAVGHTYGPDSPEAHAVSLGVDRSLGKLLDYVDKTIGLKDVLVILTADHAVSPLPEVLAAQKMPGGRLRGDFFAPIKKELEARYGDGLWLLSTAGTSPYLNYELIAQKKLDIDEVIRVAAHAIESAPHVQRVYTRTQMAYSRGVADPIDARVMRGFNADRNGDLEVILDPYYIRSSAGTTHGTPYNYDAHIPLVFMGPGIKPGRYYRSAALNDLAPSVAAMLDIEIPSGSVGRILEEMLN